MSSPAVDLTQPIIVGRTGNHHQVVKSVATASLTVFLNSPTLPIWSEWLDSGPAKSVRKVKGASHLDKILDWAADTRTPVARVNGTIALCPMRYEHMPSWVRGAQVNSVAFPNTPATNDDGEITIHVLSELSTGKAAAQAAHALWAWHLDYASWSPAQQLRISFLDQEALTHVAQNTPGAIPVVDIGLTEVSYGTLTAVATHS